MECKFTIPEQGKKAIWEITNQCNYMCKYCIFSSNCKKDKNELDTKECIHIIDELHKNGFNILKITGGEPLLRKDIIDIIKYAKEKDMKVDISTNASLITDTLAIEIKKTNIDMVHVSLDGHNKAIHEEARGENTFDRTVRGIRKLVERLVYLRIGTVLFKENENHIEDIIKFVTDLEVNEIIFSIMEPCGRLDGDYSNYITKSKDELKNEIKNLQTKYKGKIKINYNWEENPILDICPAGKKFIFINNLGEVSRCTWIKEKGYSLRKYSLSNILSIWSGSSNVCLY